MIRLHREDPMQTTAKIVLGDGESMLICLTDRQETFAPRSGLLASPPCAVRLLSRNYHNIYLDRSHAKVGYVVEAYGRAAQQHLIVLLPIS